METDLRTLTRGPLKVENTVQVNKWIRMALSAAVAILGGLIAWATSYDWAKIMEPETAGKIVFILGVVKTLYAAFAPASGTATVPTNGYVITQRGITKV